LEGVREPARPQPEKPSRAKFVNPPPVTAPTYFQDRHVETERLAGFLAEPDARLVTVVGRGGVGKTAMVCRLLKGLESGRLRLRILHARVGQGETRRRYARLRARIRRLAPHPEN